jgi:hypothetical protein
MSMAAMAFGDPGRSRRGGLIGRLSHGALRVGGRRAPHKKGRRKPRARKGGGGGRSRGIRLSNDFVKAVLLINIMKGAAHA